MGHLTVTSLVEIISCIVTVLALVFTLYLWLLDKLSEDESKFIENKNNYLETMKKSLETIRYSVGPQKLLSEVQEVNDLLEIILNYRFWARSKEKMEFEKIKEFYADTKYLISTIRRYMEAEKDAALRETLIGIPPMDKKEMEDIQFDYRKGLIYIIDFLENWS